MKRALVTVNIDNFLQENSRASFIDAAKRWHCDYVEITKGVACHPMWVKPQMFYHCDADEIVYFDADCVVWSGCHNPFIYREPGKMMVVDAFNPRFPEIEMIKQFALEDWKLLSDAFGEVPFPERFFNAGFMVVNRKEHSYMFDRLIETEQAGRTTHWQDNSPFVYCATKRNIQLQYVNEMWNYMRPDHLEDFRQMYKHNIFVYHFAGIPKNLIKEIRWL